MQKSKPANSQWTDEQWQAITEKGKDILVAAAAGSGKTAVLVERIISKITDPDHPIDVDRLLIVTFTNAAAAEMRSRIGKALEKALSENPGSLFLRRQLSLLNKASIMTCHAFCLSVVKRYYYLLDLDPSFRIIDTTEGELLREEVMEDLFEDFYSSEDNQLFYGLVDRYSNDRNDIYLQNLIQKIYDFSGSHSWPEQWLDDISQAYHVEDLTSIDELKWTEGVKAALKQQLMSLLSILKQAETLANEPGGPVPYLDNIEQDKAMIEKLIYTCDQTWEDCYQAFSNIKFTKLKAVKGDDYIEALKKQVKDLRDSVKKQVTKIQDEWFKRTPDSYLQDLKEMAPYVDQLIDLVKEFSIRYRKAKLEKGVVDFSDLEHYCLDILRDRAAVPGQELPSSVAEQYRAQFEEVLVDEYQDTNLVQETILQLVSRDQALGGNLFMVGDVKQSIYRFRLAEPGLFLTKYKQFGHVDSETGCKIDLAKNFRSRQEIIDGTNYLFKQIMDEEVGEIDYDEQAELKLGASYPEASHPAELLIINRKNNNADEETDEAEDFQAAELEAHQIAKKIKELIGTNPDEAFQVFDKDLKRNRPIQYRDIVILLRAAQSLAPTMIDILKQQGIPAHAELSTGYFDAVEVSVMMSLLNVIDNPYQDIPLAAVLRSPIVGLSGNDLAQIRLKQDKVPFYEALKAYISDNNNSLANKLIYFTEQLQSWRSRARSGALADLIWQIYRETGYYDYVVGLAGGNQRQANLKALYDRARQYEKTSFRGLFRFLRFIERMRDRGSDLGAARALSEQEDVVRIMTIHKSKGLEYPVVFVGGLNKQFNQMDLRQKALLHKGLGFGTRNIDPEKRISLPTMPFLAIKQKMAEEMLAEEMRVLYVALTRAKEKLYLIGTINDAEKTIKKWAAYVQKKSWLLPAFDRSKGKTFLDWIGPAVIRHCQADTLHEIAGEQPDKTTVSLDSSSWVTKVVPSNELLPEENPSEEKDKKWLQIKQWQPVQTNGEYIDKISRRLTWNYSYNKATSFMAKQTVTEIKRQQDYFNDGFDEAMIRQFRQPIGDRPRFLQKGQLSATEKGTAMHMMMQHVDISREISIDSLKEQGAACLANELMTPEQENSLDYEAILAFFKSSIGQRMINAPRVVRECPFSLVLDSNETYPDWQNDDNEKILVQGVIDCLIEDHDGLALIDYKTDQVAERYPSIEEAEKQMILRYEKQMVLYKTAIERIWKRKVQTVGLWSFDIGRFIEIRKEEKV
ncbi:helicase-exonuclease AddAB subunit AddA [Scopulibacillus cellulosilyticus]|uniref:ATP-dependent helicase/nuclease subunit A n=1 Tax=Scopulibacillus cellulosilyticus TaxID=2665665 RepID=A0ABW2PTA2_9BACL